MARVAERLVANGAARPDPAPRVRSEAVYAAYETLRGRRNAAFPDRRAWPVLGTLRGVCRGTRR